jgi:hypothetical protein
VTYDHGLIFADLVLLAQYFTHDAGKNLTSLLRAGFTFHRLHCYSRTAPGPPSELSQLIFPSLKGPSFGIPVFGADNGSASNRRLVPDPDPGSLIWRIPARSS